MWQRVINLLGEKMMCSMDNERLKCWCFLSDLMSIFVADIQEREKKKQLYLQIQQICNWKNLISQTVSAAGLTYFTFITRHPFTHDFTCVRRPSFQMGAIFLFSFGYHSSGEDDLTSLPGFSRSSRVNGGQGGSNLWGQLLKFSCFLSLRFK